jgi:exodeoxyribonuclease-5
MFCAFTGKAADVLRRKTGSGATLHSLFYQSRYGMDGRLKSFPLDPAEFRGKYGELSGLLVIDEGSMVGKNMMEHARSYVEAFKGLHLLVMGDPFQLPPVNEEVNEFFAPGYQPTAMMTELHRQAMENPIVRLSFMIRNTPYFNMLNQDAVPVMREEDAKASPEILKFADIVLAGRNATVCDLNHWFRTQRFGEVLPDLPHGGELLMGLNNNPDKQVYNGVVYRVAETDYADNNGTAVMIIHDAHDAPLAVPFMMEVEARRGNQVRKFYKPQFAYGDAVTVHKSQGSEWDNVIMLNEPLGITEEEHRRWQYTGVTRAAQRLLVLQPQHARSRLFGDYMKEGIKPEGWLEAQKQLKLRKEVEAEMKRMARASPAMSRRSWRTHENSSQDHPGLHCQWLWRTGARVRGRRPQVPRRGCDPCSARCEGSRVDPHPVRQLLPVVLRAPCFVRQSR